MQKNKIQKQFKKIFVLPIFLAVFGLGVFAFSSQAQAAGTYYVCDSGPICASANSSAHPDWQTGNNSNLCTSRSAPCKTIQGAIDKLPSSAPGYQVIVGNGVYVDKQVHTAPSDNPGCSHLGNKSRYTTVYLKNKSGLAGSKGTGLAGIQNYDPATWITIKAENKWGAVLDSNALTGSEANGWCVDDSVHAFTILNSDYIRVEGFEAKEYSNGGFSTMGSSDHINWANNKIHDIGYWCWVPPGDARPDWNAWQYGNGGAISTHGYDSDPTKGYDADTHALIDGNLIYNTGRLHIGQNGCTHMPGFSPSECDSNAQCSQMKANGYRPEMDYSSRDHWFYPGGVKNVVISNNIHYNNTGQDDITLSNVPSDQFYVINNTFYDGESEIGLEHTSSNGWGHFPGYIDLEWSGVSNVTIQNNILYTIETLWSSTLKIPTLVDFRGGWSNKSNITISNNLVYSPTLNTSTLIDGTDSQKYYINGSYNNIATLTGNIVKQGLLNPDPLFVNREKHNFTPLAGSPVCTGGTDGGYIGAIPCVVPADINDDGRVNIKDIQICIKGIVDPNSFAPDRLDQLAKCQAVAPPIGVVNIKDIQGIIQKIINP